MRLFEKMFGEQERPSIIELNRVLDELKEELENTNVPLSAVSAYEELIRPDIENLVNSNKQIFCDLHDNDVSNIKNWCYITANNKSGDLLETGQYNRRSLLIGHGEGLMQIFETTIKGLVQNGITDENGNHADMSFAEERIAELKDILSHVG